VDFDFTPVGGGIAAGFAVGEYRAFLGYDETRNAVQSDTGHFGGENF
jgi:hypothetical protein